MYLAATLLFACVLQSTQNQQIRLGSSFTTHLCTIHPWPELCDTNLSRGYSSHPRPLSLIFKPGYGSRVRAVRASGDNGATKFTIRAVRSLDMDMEEKVEADKKSDKSSYDFIRFG